MLARKEKTFKISDADDDDDTVHVAPLSETEEARSKKFRKIIENQDDVDDKGNIFEDLKQPFMNCQLSCTSPLPRIWAIETLACSNQVDISLLLDLLEKTPEVSDDIGRNARESVSLRILESFFVQGARTNPVSSTSSQKIILDPSDDSCEDVLLRILTEISPSHLNPPFPEMSTWDLEPFIEYKKSNFAKNTLQQLKNAILTGSHSFLASLKERCRFPDTNQPENEEPVNRKRRAISENAGDGSCENFIPSKNDCETNVASVKKYKHVIICSEQDMCGKFISSDVDAQSKSTEYLQHIEDKCTSLEGIVISDEVLPCVPCCNTEVNNKSEVGRGQDHDIEEAKSGKEGCSDLIRTEELNNIEKNILLNIPNDGEVEEVDFSRDTDGHDNGTDIGTKDNASLRSKYAHNLGSLATTTNFRDENLSVDASRIDIEEEERCSFVRSTYVVDVMGQNEPPRDGDNICSSLKGLVGHDEALPSEKQGPHATPQCGDDKFDGEEMQNDEDGNAGDENGLDGIRTTTADMDKAEEDVDISSDSDGYHDERIKIDTNKKTFLSSQCTHSQDSLATTDWRELNLCVKCNLGGILLVCGSGSCPIGIHRRCLDSDEIFDTTGEFYCPFCSYSRAISKYMEIKKRTALARKDLATCLGTPKGSNEKFQRLFEVNQNHFEQNDGGCLPRINEMNRRDAKNVRKRQRKKKIEYDDAEPSEHSPPFVWKVVNSTNIITHTLNEDEQRVKKTRHHGSQSPKAREKHHMASIRPKKGMLHSSGTDLPRENKFSRSSQSADVEETSEEENENSGVSKYFIRVRKQERQHSYPVIPQLRRIRIPWTSEEEEKLKEGMRLHCSPHDKIIPWKRILEHGAGTFCLSRSTMDLKDKWRNMCKSTPKSNEVHIALE